MDNENLCGDCGAPMSEHPFGIAGYSTDICIERLRAHIEELEDENRELASALEDVEAAHDALEERIQKEYRDD